MSVVGIDFGNLQSIVAVARNRGIDVVCNEVSNRATPSLVSFGPKQRYLGESAKTQEIGNFKNTVGSLQRLIGRSYSDPDILEVETKFTNAKLVKAEGSSEVAVQVQYLGQPQVFTATQLTAMYFGKLRDIAAAELNIPVTDCVISVPGWFTDVQRRAVRDASSIAGLNCLRLINDTTASALGYGITKTDLPEDKPRHVVIVDCGHASYSVTVVAYMKGQLTVKATAHDRHFGGRYFDQLLVDHFAKEIQEKYKLDVLSNPKALTRLRVGCEKMKKVLSANAQSPLNIESIMEDRDVNGMLTRDEFEAMATELISRVEAPLDSVLADSGLTKEDIDAVELVGGCTRIPAVKDRLTQYFGKVISTTLNQDEAVARGAALQCAMLSPVFKVRDFAVHDLTNYPVKFTWASVSDDTKDSSELNVFSRKNTIPSTKILTFYRREPFDIEAYYVDPESLPAGTNPWIGKYTIKNVAPKGDGELATIKVKARINLHGIIGVEAAHSVEEIIKEEEPEVPMETDEKPAADAAAADAAAAEPAPKKTKKILKKTELPVTSSSNGLDKAKVSKLTELENEFTAADKLVADTEERKNALEEYIYETRSKLDVTYGPFVKDDIKATFSELLAEAEDWLYGEGEETTKSVYINKLAELTKIGHPIAYRYRESIERPKAQAELRLAIEQYAILATSQDEQYSHITAEEKQQVVDRCEKEQTWLMEQMEKQSLLSKSEDPILISSQLIKQQEDLVVFATGIMNRPKPPAPKEETPLPNGNTTPTPDAEPTNAATNEEKPEMDVD